MKAITLTQPWATLMAYRCKQIETRSWYTDYRGPIAIHAAAGLGPVGGRRGLRALCECAPFDSVLESIGFDADSLPLGVVLATGALTAVHRIPATPMHFARGVPDNHPLASYPVVLPPQRYDGPERAFGDYTPGRFAWIFTDVQALPEPVPAKGALGLWEWEDQP